MLLTMIVYIVLDFTIFHEILIGLFGERCIQWSGSWFKVENIKHRRMRYKSLVLWGVARIDVVRHFHGRPRETPVTCFILVCLRLERDSVCCPRPAKFLFSWGEEIPYTWRCWLCDTTWYIIHTVSRSAYQFYKAAAELGSVSGSHRNAIALCPWLHTIRGRATQ